MSSVINFISLKSHILISRSSRNDNHRVSWSFAQSATMFVRQNHTSCFLVVPPRQASSRFRLICIHPPNSYHLCSITFRSRRPVAPSLKSITFSRGVFHCARGEIFRQRLSAFGNGGFDRLSHRVLTRLSHRVLTRLSHRVLTKPEI